MVSCQSRNAALALRADFTFSVMPGLVPGIHVFLPIERDVDAAAVRAVPAMTSWKR